MFRECYSSSGSVLFPKRDMLVFFTTKYCWNDKRFKYFLSGGLVCICVCVQTYSQQSSSPLLPHNDSVPQYSTIFSPPEAPLDHK